MTHYILSIGIHIDCKNPAHIMHDNILFPRDYEYHKNIELQIVIIDFISKYTIDIILE